MALLNLVNDIKNETLIPNAYFQRDLVWREIHKKDFIKTIFLSYPFPQIFISKGKVNLERMINISCIVDGQQRSNAIIEYIDNKFEVDGKYFNDLTDEEKSNFLKYEIAVIELDLHNDDERVKEIFQRINRTSNSLSIIEKTASEYSTSEMMLVGKLLTDQIDIYDEQNENFKEDPNIPKEFFTWAKSQQIKNYVKLITEKGIFSQRELARKVHLMHTLNIISTIIGGFFNRNEKTMAHLSDFKDEFPQKNEIISLLEKSAIIIHNLKLKQKSYWLNKSNIFSLIVAIAITLNEGKEVDPLKLANALAALEESLTDEYKLAASEGVNSKQARILRHDHIEKTIRKSLA